MFSKKASTAIIEDWSCLRTKIEDFFLGKLDDFRWSLKRCRVAAWQEEFHERYVVDPENPRKRSLGDHNFYSWTPLPDFSDPNWRYRKLSLLRSLTHIKEYRARNSLLPSLKNFKSWRRAVVSFRLFTNHIVGLNRIRIPSSSRGINKAMKAPFSLYYPFLLIISFFLFH